MSSYAEVVNGIVDVIEGISGGGLVRSRVPFDGSVDLPDVDGWFHVTIEGGQSVSGAPTGDNHGITEHAVTVSFIQRFSPNAPNTGQDTALGRIEGIRNNLDSPTALDELDAYAEFVDYTIDRSSYPRHLVVTVGFAVTHSQIREDS
jgi:hypothetical protein